MFLLTLFLCSLIIGDITATLVKKMANLSIFFSPQYIVNWNFVVTQNEYQLSRLSRCLELFCRHQNILKSHQFSNLG